jgi:hypothetical protein
MPTYLRITALVLWLSLLGWWAAAGMNTGWTKTSVSTMETDPITGIEYPVWKKQFVPGVDLVAAGTGCAVALVTLSFLPLRKRNPNHKNQ